VDTQSIGLTVLTRLVKRGELKQEILKQAIDRYGLGDGVAAVSGSNAPAESGGAA
jgi:pyruvate dehydrogenase E1 component